MKNTKIDASQVELIKSEIINKTCGMMKQIWNSEGSKQRRVLNLCLETLCMVQQYQKPNGKNQVRLK